MGELQDDRAETATVNKSNGYYKVSLPKDIGDDLDLADGDRLLIGGSKGDRGVRVVPARQAANQLF